jgi:hypothetical protein
LLFAQNLNHFLFLKKVYLSFKRQNSFNSSNKHSDLDSLTLSDTASKLSRNSTADLIKKDSHNYFDFPLEQNNNNNSNTKTQLKEICISLPLAKPNLNELNPQLDLSSSSVNNSNNNKMRAKTLIERRGSNNSLTLNITPIKKKLCITNPALKEW